MLCSFFNLFFDWRKIVLQWCVGFCHTAMRISHNYTYIPSFFSLTPLPPRHPSRSSQNTSLGSLGYAAASHQLSLLHMIVYICLCYRNGSLNIWQIKQTKKPLKTEKTMNNPDLMGYIEYWAQQLENTHSFQAQNLALDYAIKLASGGSKTCSLSCILWPVCSEMRKCEEEKKNSKTVLI